MILSRLLSCQVKSRHLCVSTKSKRFLDFARNDRANCRLCKSGAGEDQSFAESSRPSQRWLSRNRNVHRADSLCDKIEIEQRSGEQEIAFRCDDPSVPKGEDNIVVRAANVFFEETKITSGVSIGSKRRFHTAQVWVEEAATLLPLCWRSTNCSKQIYRAKRWRKWRRRSDRTFHFSFFNPPQYAKGVANW